MTVSNVANTSSGIAAAGYGTARDIDRDEIIRVKNAPRPDEARRPSTSVISRHQRAGDGGSGSLGAPAGEVGDGGDGEELWRPSGSRASARRMTSTSVTPMRLPMQSSRVGGGGGSDGSVVQRKDGFDAIASQQREQELHAADQPPLCTSLEIGLTRSAVVTRASYEWEERIDRIGASTRHRRDRGS